MKDVDVFAGVIVHKENGQPLMVLAASPMAEDLTLYDRGYQYTIWRSRRPQSYTRALRTRNRGSAGCTAWVVG
ncbi:hypothetical protein BST22_06840 [Mycolicibacterium chubuense]|uniref:Uncharacterized protein n=1 Tax=Mycolicibacterium chubuense TaxID=1800 RepID=A0A0J6YYZ4_MYCCU|nr:hypothetical protein MCHUDSM44219_03271 [Mycolicibacterium chubuense]ORA54327.1 hypothetical protein BST22_06840 [Mycolicibacterium chubuense]SPX96693.1 Uncharacterised protein [Mycolicibacterium chubuense]